MIGLGLPLWSCIVDLDWQCGLWSPISDVHMLCASVCMCIHCVAFVCLCFSRYKALRFGEYAKEAFLLCVREQLRNEEPDHQNDHNWLASKLEYYEHNQSEMRKVHINKQAFATFIGLVTGNAMELKRSSSGVGGGLRSVLLQAKKAAATAAAGQQAGSSQSHHTGAIQDGQGGSMSGSNTPRGNHIDIRHAPGLRRSKSRPFLLDGTNPRFEKLVNREFELLDEDKGGTIDVQEFHSCFGRYYRAFLPHSRLVFEQTPLLEIEEEDKEGKNSP